LSGRLQGRVALISGAGRGIGRQIALKLGGEGARVVVNDLDADEALAVVDLIRSEGGEATPFAADVTTAAFADGFVQTALDAYGDLHIVVNNAGYPWDAVIQKTSDEQFQAMLDVHLLAPFRVLRAAYDPIRARFRQESEEGREVVRKVVNISSVSGVFGNAGQVSYSAAKSALAGLTRSLCKEWGRYKVTVNCVAFGLIDTRLSGPAGAEGTTIQIGEHQIAVGVRPQLRAEAERLVPLGRIGTPQEAAGAVFLFCIPESDYVSGETLICSGGLVI